MRALLLAIVMLCTACGNWSNRDLEFVQALPDENELQSKLKVLDSSTQPLTQRQDPLGAGDPSTAYADAKKAQNDFNTLLQNLLGAIQGVKQIAPTTRTADSRIWGPFTDSNNPGFDFRVVITEVNAASFTYAVQCRPQGSDFFDVLSGNYVPTADLTHGQGALTLHVKDIRGKLKLTPPLDQLDQIDVGYFTASFPTRVDMTFTFTAGASSGLSAAGFTYRELADQSGSLAFELRTNDVNTTVLDAVSMWNGSGAGRAAEKVVSGTYAGATVVECWDTDFKIAYLKQGYPGGVESGLASDCVVIDGL